MRTVALPDGKRVPVLRQGTWRMGESKSARANEVAALRLGIELGMSLIDTAEIYDDGGAEEIAAEATLGQHPGTLVVTNVYPHNASLSELVEAQSPSASVSTPLISYSFMRGDPHPLPNSADSSGTWS